VALDGRTQDPAAETSAAPAEIDKLRFDYAWKWFAFHADQRVKMFNFMLVATGFFAAAVASTYDKSPAVARALSVAAAIVSLIFTRLDRRNQDLVWLGEDVLVELERRMIFGRGATIEGRDGRSTPFGILWAQARSERDHPPTVIQAYWRGRHRLWLRRIGYLIAALFIVLAGLTGLRLRPATAPPETAAPATALGAARSGPLPKAPSAPPGPAGKAPDRRG
jgi:hypothetical protein